MLYYSIPKCQHTLNKGDFNIVFSDYPPKPFINKSLYQYLIKLKNIIHLKPAEWNVFKLITNPYEYIHTFYEDKKYISKLKPISRSFYKLIEIYNVFDVLNDLRNEPVNTLHLAEGPGGFIEATQYMRKTMSPKLHKKDKYIGITLINEKNKIIPSWDKLKQKNQYSNVFLDYCSDNKGDLYNINNMNYVYSKYKNSMNIITADGGFDFSSNYNEQEQSILRLLLVQTMYAVICQKKNGTFIMKIFDNFNRGTNDIIYMLTCFYDKVIICKPKTSRYANSEKYLVCKMFKYNNSTGFYSLFVEIMEELIMNPNKYIYSIMVNYMHQIMSVKIQDINAIFGQQQLEIMNTTLSIIDSKKNYDLDSMKYNHIQKCILWFQAHNIPYNAKKYLNIHSGKYSNSKHANILC